ALRRGEAERLAVRPRDRAVHRIEFERAPEGQRGDDLRAGQERERGGAAVVAAREVAVERGDDGIGLLLADVAPLPLPDAGAARVGEHGAPDLLEGLHDAVAL